MSFPTVSSSPASPSQHTPQKETYCEDGYVIIDLPPNGCQESVTREIKEIDEDISAIAQAIPISSEASKAPFKVSLSRDDKEPVMLASTVGPKSKKRVSKRKNVKTQKVRRRRKAQTKTTSSSIKIPFCPYAVPMSPRRG